MRERRRRHAILACSLVLGAIVLTAVFHRDIVGVAFRVTLRQRPGALIDYLELPRGTARGALFAGFLETAPGHALIARELARCAIRETGLEARVAARQRTVLEIDGSGLVHFTSYERGVATAGGRATPPAASRRLLVALRARLGTLGPKSHRLPGDALLLSIQDAARAELAVVRTAEQPHSPTERIP